MKITYLDLGGTACNETRDTVAVSLDGSAAGDAICHRVIADYKHLPFADNQFTESFGGCFLEDSPWDIEDALREVIRTSVAGAHVILNSCSPLEEDHFKIPIKLGLFLNEEPSLWFDQGFAYIDHPFDWVMMETTKETCLASETPKRTNERIYELTVLDDKTGELHAIVRLTSESGFVRGYDEQGLRYLLVRE